MALRLRDVTLTLEEGEERLPGAVARTLGIPRGDICDLKIVRRGIDARKKPRILFVYTVDVFLTNEDALLKRHDNDPRIAKAPLPMELPEFAGTAGHTGRVVVVGMGPAGLFAALRLARLGHRVTLAERGRPVERRVRDVRLFWERGSLDPESNVQFGEGGAGTFSDGKLTTRINHPWTSFVLKTLVDFGAPEDILIQAKPHVGTDRLRLVLLNFRKELQSAGVDLRYETCLTGFESSENAVRAALLDGREEVPCDALVLAPGHSARDTYAMLHAAGVAMEAKPFAIGVRVEHPTELINAIQYGFANHPRLPAAEYALAFNDPQTGRGVYSFCMCPGGEVIVASSEPGKLVVNGMSSLSRSGSFSNSALVVSVRPSDFEGGDPLAGVCFQRRWEEAAFAASGESYCAPAQNVMDFLGMGKGSIRSTVLPGVREADLSSILPLPVVEGLRNGLPHFNRRMKGFVSAEATLIGVETRTSAPLRILRGEDGQSLSHRGLYPAGEGAGYAGGIMSAALDGLRAAEHIAEMMRNRSHG